mgnify:CR=1 FL=1
MYKVIGKNNCNACSITKTILTNKNIYFEYYVLEDLTQEEQDNYIQLAQEQSKVSMPLIIDENNKILTLQEV